jgi:hypothetical protein
MYTLCNLPPSPPPPSPQPQFTENGGMLQTCFLIMLYSPRSVNSSIYLPPTLSLRQLSAQLVRLLESSMSKLANLSAYLQRIGVKELTLPKNNLETLTRLMDGQSRAIPFENLDVVQRKTISMTPADVEAKLVGQERGGYCFGTHLCMRAHTDTYMQTHKRTNTHTRKCAHKCFHT